MMRRPSPLFVWLVDHAIFTFLLMATSFTVFGVLSLNLAQYIMANAHYLLSYGWMALRDDGLVQFLELWSTVFIATAAFVVFKVCEVALVERIAHRGDAPGSENARPVGRTKIVEDLVDGDT